MSLSESTRTEIRNCLSILKVIAGVVLLAAISWEIIAGDHMHFSRNYLIIQLVVCILFLCDFFVRWAASERKARFFGRNFLVLLISIPYLNIIDWSSAELPRYWATLIGIMPLMRAFLAFYIVVQWLVDNKVRKLFFAYIFTVVVFTYISALVFYDYEILVNSKLHGFGNALWWAWMNVDRRGRDIPRDDHRQDILRDAPLAGHDVLPDLHDLRTAGVLAQKRVRPIGRTPLFGETSPISSAPSAGRGFR